MTKLLMGNRWAQVVALVTEGQQRPEVPAPSEVQGAAFGGYREYVDLMQRCWAQVRLLSALSKRFLATRGHSP